MIGATLWPTLKNPQGRRFATTWERLIERLARPIISASKDGVPGLSLATFAGDRRALVNVETVHAVALDLDHLDALSTRMQRAPGTVYDLPDWDSLRRMFRKTAAFVHSTWSSSLQCPRLRVFLRLSRAVTSAEYRRVYEAVASHSETRGLVVDRQASDASRFWYLPSVAPDGYFVSWACDGAPVNVDRALAATPGAPPPPPARPPLPTSDVDRARRYLAKCEPAIAGSGGHRATFDVAQRLVHRFGLDEGSAYSLLANDYNPRCVPPWSERDLRRKVQQALTTGRLR